MRAKATALLAAAAVLVAGVMPARSAPENGPEAPACVSARTEARYRNAGYDHIVILRNACEAPAVCTVTTNVNPDTQTVNIGAGTEVEVLTFRGSPAREFEARVRCALEASR